MGHRLHQAQVIVVDEDTQGCGLCQVQVVLVGRDTEEHRLCQAQFILQTVRGPHCVPPYKAELCHMLFIARLCFLSPSKHVCESVSAQEFFSSEQAEDEC